MSTLSRYKSHPELLWILAMPCVSLQVFSRGYLYLLAYLQVFDVIVLRMGLKGYTHDGACPVASCTIFCAPGYTPLVRRFGVVAVKQPMD